MDDRGSNGWHDPVSVEHVRELLERAVLAASVAELEMPHLVICLDRETGAASYSGPFADALGALTFAERESAVDRALNPETPMRFSVAALYPGPVAGAD